MLPCDGMSDAEPHDQQLTNHYPRLVCNNQHAALSSGRFVPIIDPEYWPCQANSLQPRKVGRRLNAPGSNTGSDCPGLQPQVPHQLPLTVSRLRAASQTSHLFHHPHLSSLDVLGANVYSTASHESGLKRHEPHKHRATTSCHRSYIGLDSCRGC